MWKQIFTGQYKTCEEVLFMVIAIVGREVKLDSELKYLEPKGGIILRAGVGRS